MLLKLALWQDVEEYLARRDDVVVPIGSTEQHGPSGPLGSGLIVVAPTKEDIRRHEARAGGSEAWLGKR